MYFSSAKLDLVKSSDFWSSHIMKYRFSDKIYVVKGFISDKMMHIFSCKYTHIWECVFEEFEGISS